MMVASGFAPALLQKGAPQKKVPKSSGPKKRLKTPKSFSPSKILKSFESTKNSRVGKKKRGWFQLQTPFPGMQMSPTGF